MECSVLMNANDTVVLSQLLELLKTEAMLFGSSQKHGKKNQFSVTINGSAIKRVTDVKYLGVIWDEHLS